MNEADSKQRLDTIEAPYNRTVWLDEVKFESGMRLMRVTIREGRRITQIDIDAETAAHWVRLWWAGQELPIQANTHEDAPCLIRACKSGLP